VPKIRRKEIEETKHRGQVTYDKRTCKRFKDKSKKKKKAKGERRGEKKKRQIKRGGGGGGGGKKKSTAYPLKAEKIKGECNRNPGK